jgi:spore maturation protein CgeB
MTIVVPGLILPDSFVRNIVVTLEGMGHKAVNVPTAWSQRVRSRLFKTLCIYTELGIPQLEIAAWNRLVRTVARLQPELVLLPYAAPPQVLRLLRDASGAKIVCWFTDAISNFYRSYLIAGSYDALFIKEPSLVPLLRNKLGLNAHYLPEACNPLWHNAVCITEQDRSEFGCDLVAQGNLHYYRARMLEPFHSYDLRIWGPQCRAWIDSPSREKHQGRCLAEHTKAKALRAAKIVLNTMFYTEVEGVNNTLFEAAGCGAFQIADWKPALPALFEPETEIVTFRTRAELQEKVEYYLSHPKERDRIAQRAHDRAHRDHTYELRLRTIFSVVGLGGNLQNLPNQAKQLTAHAKTC